MVARGLATPLAGDVGSRAMAGFVQALPPGVQGGRRQHADGTGQHRGLVGEDVAEQVARDDDVELPRAPAPVAWRHCPRTCGISVTSGYSRATSIMISRQNWEVSSTLALSTLHSLRLRLRAASKADARDAADFRLAVAHGVIAFALAGKIAIRRAAYRRAGCRSKYPRPLAHDENVQAGDHFRLQRGRVGQFRIQNGGTQVGEQGERSAQAQDRLLGRNSRGRLSYFQSPTAPNSTARADCASCNVAGGSGCSGSNAAPPTGACSMSGPASERTQHAHGLVDDLGADAITGKDRNLCVIYTSKKARRQNRCRG